MLTYLLSIIIAYSGSEDLEEQVHQQSFIRALNARLRIDENLDKKLDIQLSWIAVLAR